ncbi:hypothetical protein D3C87_1666160 [compost metagenome]
MALSKKYGYGLFLTLHPKPLQDLRIYLVVYRLEYQNHQYLHPLTQFLLRQMRQFPRLDVRYPQFSLNDLHHEQEELYKKYKNNHIHLVLLGMYAYGHRLNMQIQIDWFHQLVHYGQQPSRFLSDH